MRQPLRFFAVGLLVASILLYGYYFFFVSSNVKETELETDELIAQIEEDGYRVISEEDYLSFTFLKQQEEDKENESNEDTEEPEKDKEDKDKADKKEDSEKEEDKNKEKEEEQKEEEEDVKKHTFTTDENVVSQNVADELINNGIIDDRQAFLDYLDENDYSSYVQIGTFTVSSDMSFKELAEIITTYPGN